MAISKAEFDLRFPAFDGVGSGSVEVQLSDAEAQLDRDAFPNQTVYERAVYLMAAHRLTVQGLGTGAEATIAAGGVALDAVQSVSDGGLSISMKARTGRNADSPLAGSQYGRELLHILQHSSARIVTAGGGKSHARGYPYAR